MNELFNEVINGAVTVSVNLSNAWIVEFVSQNYLYIIWFFIILFVIWFTGLFIKNWIWKIDKISGSLEKIALSLDYLATKADKEPMSGVFTEKPIENSKK